MKVLLINVDSVIPNLALLKISAFHKSLGDDVSFNNTDDLTLVDQQYDIRLVDEKVAQRIKNLRIKRFLHFAFDTDELEPIIRTKVELLKQAGLDIRNDIEFYVYVDSDSQYDSGLKRCRILKSLGTNSFVMFNKESKRTGRISKLIRWANRKQVYWKCDLDDYTRKYG